MADINRNEEKVPAPEEIHGLAAALDQFGADFDPYEYMDTVEDKEQNIRDTETLDVPAEVRNFSYTEANGKLYYKEDGGLIPVEVPAATEERIRGMIALRDITRNLIETQLNGGSDAQIAQLQTRLNSAYDSFTAKWGLLNSTGNKRAFEQDSSYCLLCSLEVLDEDRNLERKADMFSKRTINQEKRIDHVDTPVEALAVSIGERAGVDLSFMAEILDRPGEELEIAKELSGVIFKNPEKGLDHPLEGWENADEYLSGNVRKKLAAARAAAERDPAYAVNVSALEQSQPKDLSAAEIDVRIGATWIDPKYYTQFTYELLKTPGYLRGDTIAARYSAATGEWNISGKTRDSANNTLAYVTYGTKRKNAYAIIEDSLNLRDCRVYDNVIRDKYGKSDQMRYVNDLALAPIGYVRHSHPIQKAYGANSYTKNGRELVHKKLEGIDMAVLHDLMRNPIEGESIEFNDNRLSLYSAQKGKCAVTGNQMDADDVVCIRKTPKEQGGTDKYSNLLLVCRNIQKLLYIKNPDTFIAEMEKLNLDLKRTEKLLKLRSLTFVESC